MQSKVQSGVIMKKAIPTCLILFMGLLSNSTSAIEEPAYTVVHTWDEPEIEIRHYAPRLLAQTSMNSTESNGFRILAGYIFGGNETEQEIAMTAPVQRTMGDSANATMAFVMPSELTLDALPKPDDDRVQFIEEPAYHAAVIRFNGRATETQADAHWQTLFDFLATQSIVSTGPPTLNQYNPPWTLPFMRRNEIIVPIQSPNDDFQKTY